MKKRLVICMVLLALMICMLSACTTGTTANTADEGAITTSNFKVIEEKDYLAYDVDTRVVYYMFSTHESTGYGGYGYAYFAPYVSENGNFCRYINDEIVEITNEQTNNN